MSNLMTIIFIAVSVVVTAIAIVALYYLYYSKAINKRLKERPQNRKRMLSPKTVVIVAIITALLLFSVSVLLVRMKQSEAINIGEQYLTAQYDYEVFTPQEMQQGYLESYSIDNNIGYKKHEEILGDIKFTYFVSLGSYDVYHPAFIIYVQYIGQEDIVSFGYQGDYLTNEHIKIAGKEGAGADAQEYICILGNTSIDCIFQLSLFYYGADGDMSVNKDLNTAGTDATGNNADYAIAAETIRIVIPRTGEKSQ